MREIASSLRIMFSLQIHRSLTLPALLNWKES